MRTALLQPRDRPRRGSLSDPESPPRGPITKPTVDVVVRPVYEHRTESLRRTERAPVEGTDPEVVPEYGERIDRRWE
ncbi:hypothetical protein [Halalkalicoccus salilacus]|uniref:hypothetical protein n=1 Tax=Halalkalicoccus salilacus TaxID=3117459 RepID=UPI00300EB672